MINFTIGTLSFQSHFFVFYQKQFIKAVTQTEIQKLNHPSHFTNASSTVPFMIGLEM